MQAAAGTRTDRLMVRCVMSELLQTRLTDPLGSPIGLWMVGCGEIVFEAYYDAWEVEELGNYPLSSVSYNILWNTVRVDPLFQKRNSNCSLFGIPKPSAPCQFCRPARYDQNESAPLCGFHQ